jgi:hypothetical protein
METWIKLYRKFSEWEWFNISEMVHLFIYLLISANNKDGEWRGVIVKRGQILTGLNSLHQHTKISYQTLRTCLKRLEKTKEINIQSTNQYSIITICNYDNYQDKQQTTNKRNNKQLTSDQQTTNNKQEYKEVKNEKKYKNIPPLLEEIDIRIKERLITSFTAETFFAHYNSNGWMVGKNKMKDWDSALTTWNSKKFNNNENNSGNNKRSVKRINQEWDN